MTACHSLQRLEVLRKIWNSLYCYPKTIFKKIILDIQFSEYPQIGNCYSLKLLLISAKETSDWGSKEPKGGSVTLPRPERTDAIFCVAVADIELSRKHAQKNVTVCFVGVAK